MSSVNLLFTATTPDDLAKVTWLTHDCFFELDAVRHDEGAGRFEIAFGRGRERTGWFGITSSTTPATHDCLLFVSCVRDVEVDDEAQIGTYDIESVSYVSDKSSVVIEANIPLKITLRVDKLDVRVLTRGEPHTAEGGLSWYTEGADLQALDAGPA